MKCRQCGSELADDARFCNVCGALVEGATTDETTSDTQQPNEVSGSGVVTDMIYMELAKRSKKSISFPAMMNKTKEKSQRHILRPVLLIAIMVALVAGTIYALYCIPKTDDDLSVETVRQDFEKTDYFEDGIVPSNYVNESSYELDGFSIDVQDEQSNTTLGTEDIYRTVNFSGTMKNESFETKFTGEVDYMKADNDGDGKTWEPVAASEPNLGFEITYDETIPISGVDEFSDVITSTNTTDYTYRETDFTSSKPELEDGFYTTIAQATSTYKFWYATDTAIKTQNFTFNSESGWEPDGDAEPSNTHTSWDALIGMTFDMRYNGYVGLLGSADVEASLTFIRNDENNDITAHYTIAYNPTEKDSNGVGTLTPVNIEGEASCSYSATKHEFGKDDVFEFTLVDEAQNVEFTCRKCADENLQQSGMVLHAMLVDITTDSEYYSQGSGENEFSRVFELPQAEFIENRSSLSTNPDTEYPDGLLSDDYILPDSDTRVYDRSELEGMSDYELYLARNEIAARHGRGFDNEDLQHYFDSKDWYTKLYEPEEYDALPEQLNSTEQQNADLIRSIEQERNSEYI